MLDGGGERLVVGDPAVLAVQLPAQPLDGGSRPPARPLQRRRRDRPQVPALALPGHQLGRHGALLEHPDAVEVLHVVDRVRDVVGRVHHRRLGRLLPVRDPPGERLPCLPQVVQLGAVRAELHRTALRILRRRSRAPGRRVQVARVRIGVVQPGPRVLQHGRPDRGGQVQPGGRRAADLGAGDDPVRLGVALEAVGQPEALPGQPVEHPLPQMPERRVPEVVRERGGLHHLRVAAAELLQQVPVRRVGRQPLRDRPGHLGHLQAVGEPVVHQQPGTTRADHLGDAVQPGEERRPDDPVPVGPERAGGQVAERPGAAAEQPPGPRIRRCLHDRHASAADGGAGTGGRRRTAQCRAETTREGG